jgi:hypothetical protein
MVASETGYDKMRKVEGDIIEGYEPKAARTLAAEDDTSEMRTKLFTPIPFDFTRQVD